MKPGRVVGSVDIDDRAMHNMMEPNPVALVVFAAKPEMNKGGRCGGVIDHLWQLGPIFDCSDCRNRGHRAGCIQKATVEQIA